MNVFFGFYKKLLCKKDTVFSLRNISREATFSTSAVDENIWSELLLNIIDNVRFIESISSEHFLNISKEILHSIQFGNGLADLVPYFQTYGVDINIARNIANEQTILAYSDLNFIRMKQSGIQNYEWIYIGSENPICAEEHILLNGNEFSFSDPPIINIKDQIKGKPGDFPGCKCSMRPIVSFDEGN